MWVVEGVNCRGYDGVNMQVNTLVHEIAHELLHHPSELPKQQKEIQAEGVAYTQGNNDSQKQTVICFWN